MLKTRFKFYMQCIAYPLAVAGIVMLLFPDSAIHHLFRDSIAPGTVALRLFVRVCAGSFLLISVLLLNAMSSPDTYRGILFWCGLYFLYLCFSFGAGPYLFQMHWSAIGAAVYAALAALFLIGYASRNILVRE